MPQPKPITVLSIVRYPSWAIPFAFFSMAIFRLPLWLSKKISFYKLMGSGRNGTFDKTPDWRQWAVLCVVVEKFEVSNKPLANGSLINPQSLLANNSIPSFLKKYWKLFGCITTVYVLEPIEGHGLWDGKKVFGDLPKQTDYGGKIAVLTRATIRFSKLKDFWGNVDGIAKKMTDAEGFVTSYGIGEIPFIKQATFSVWDSKWHMKNFAYKMREHAEVIQKTHQENWYSEEMFVRFKILKNFVV